MDDAIHKIGHRRGEEGFAGKRRTVEYVSFGKVTNIRNIQLTSREEKYAQDND